MSQETKIPARTEIIDIEEYAKSERPVPHGCRYRIRIDKKMIVVDEPCLTGTEILKLVDKTPQEFLLSQRLRGGEVKRIGPDDKVDFTAPGIERFMTLPLDPTEGGGDETETGL
jgi:Multiubiquitin